MKRNHVGSLVTLLLWATTTSAQIALPPNEEYRLTASATTITLSKGQLDSVKVSIHRSKSFKSDKASIALNLPSEAGLTMWMKQYFGQPEEFIIYLSAAADAKAGEYNVIPTCTLRNKSKGIILKLIIK